MFDLHAPVMISISLTAVHFQLEAIINKPIPHLSFRIGLNYSTFVTSTWIGRIDMSCANEQ